MVTENLMIKNSEGSASGSNIITKKLMDWFMDLILTQVIQLKEISFFGKTLIRGHLSRILQQLHLFTAVSLLWIPIYRLTMQADSNTIFGSGYNYPVSYTHLTLP